MTRPGLDRALTAVARTRATGLHFFGHFLDVSAAPADGDGVRLVLPPEPVTRPGPASPVALATLADLAMGWSIRARLGPGRRLGTTTLAVNHLREIAPGPVTASAQAVRVDEDPEGGFARCDLRDATGALVAAVDGWFVSVPPPAGRPLPPVPWETAAAAQPTTDLSIDELEPQERAAVEAGTAAAARAEARGTSVVEELLGLEAVELEGQTSTTVMRIGPEHSNRVGHAQGGVVYGAAALSAGRVLGPGTSLTSGTLQFLRPAEGAVLVCRATVLRRGRRAVFTEVLLSKGDTVVAAGQFTAVVPQTGS